MKLLRFILFACSTADIIGKFEQLALHALTKPRVAELRDAVLGLEKLTDAARLADLMRAGGPSEG